MASIERANLDSQGDSMTLARYATADKRVWASLFILSGSSLATRSGRAAI